MSLSTHPSITPPTTNTHISTDNPSPCRECGTLDSCTARWCNVKMTLLPLREQVGWLGEDEEIPDHMSMGVILPVREAEALLGIASLAEEKAEEGKALKGEKGEAEVEKEKKGQVEEEKEKSQVEKKREE